MPDSPVNTKPVSARARYAVGVFVFTRPHAVMKEDRNWTGPRGDQARHHPQLRKNTYSTPRGIQRQPWEVGGWSAEAGLLGRL